MDRLLTVITQQQCAGEWFVIRVFDNYFRFSNDSRNCSRVNSALEHALEGVTGEVQRLAFHIAVRGE